MVHREGRGDSVRKGGPRASYQRRQLLGFTPTNEQLIRDLILGHLNARQRKQARYSALPQTPTSHGTPLSTFHAYAFHLVIADLEPAVFEHPSLNNRSTSP